MTSAVLAGFADISIPQLLLIAGMGVLTSLIGGVAGYGTLGGRGKRSNHTDQREE